ncbi:MAG: hypothetical protein ACXVZX_03735 [Terriglobales bacterium]
MFSGKMIDELFEIVERAEEQAHFEMKSESSEDEMFPGFLANVNTNQVWLGVA